MKYLILPIFFFTGLLQHHQQEILEWQKELNAEYADANTSPLERKDLKKFKGLSYFPIDEKYRITAKLTLTPGELPFTMPTTTDRLPIYVKYGFIRFKLEGETHQLSLYKSQAVSMKEGYEDYLFLPFTDLTNGDESYGGGRYIDARIPLGDSLTIDFNKAYNPYCAYNGKYSCPIPPIENDLPIAIRAGVKAWDKH